MNSSQAKALVYYMFAALGGNVKGQMALVIINNFSIINGISQHSQDLSIYMRLAILVSPAGIPSLRLAWFNNNNKKFLYYYYICIENFTCFDS